MRAFLTSVMIVTVIICWNTSASAQGFKEIFDNLDAIEKRLDQLEPKDNKHIITLMSQLAEQKPGGGGGFFRF